MTTPDQETARAIAEAFFERASTDNLDDLTARIALALAAVRAEARREERERYTDILDNPLILCLAMPEDCQLVGAEAPCVVHSRTAGYIAALAQERP